jgi:hypothetical protein
MELARKRAPLRKSETIRSRLQEQYQGIQFEVAVRIERGSTRIWIIITATVGIYQLWQYSPEYGLRGA